MNNPFDRVKVRIAVREIERYERVVEMPRALFEESRRRLDQASPDVVGDVAFLLVDCFVDDREDEVDELTEIEAFELADPEAQTPATLQVFDGFNASLAAAVAVGATLDADSLEQGDQS